MTEPPARIPAWIDGILQPVDKLHAHREGIPHKAVSVFVVDGSHILLQRRAEGKYHTPGLWANACCTHPHWEEDPADCAYRRLVEELGITGLTPKYRGTVEYRADVGGGMTENEVVDMFLAQAERLQLDINPDPDEVMATRWITLHDLAQEIDATPEIFTPWLRIYMARHRDVIFGLG